jgi:hypothetical protein
MPNKTKQKGGQHYSQHNPSIGVSALRQQVESLQSNMGKQILQKKDNNGLNTKILMEQAEMLNEMKPFSKLGKRESPSKAPVPSRTKTNLNKARKNALRPNSPTKEYSSQKTRCNNNKRVPWYRKTIPMSRDITFEVLHVSNEKSVNVKTGVTSESVIVRVTWKSDVVNEKKDGSGKKEIIGIFEPIGKDSFKVRRMFVDNLARKKIYYEKTPAPGTCYQFKVGNTDMAKIRGKIFDFKNLQRQKHFGY